MTDKIKIGISDCLLGAKVRYNGGHKRDGFICDVLSEFFDFVAICPEVGAGLGIPRPAIRLIGDPDNPQAVFSDDATKNVTKKLEDYSRKRLKQFKDVSGFILKNRSPSCGMERVKVYNAKNFPEMKGTGVFAKILLDAFPNLPIEEEGRLCDPILRENFLERIFVYKRWQEMLASRVTPAKLVEFHTIHKYSIMSHSAKHFRELGRMIAKIDKKNLKGFCDNYITLLMQALKVKSTRKKHRNVLEHLLGYLKKQLNTEQKQELLECLDQYSNETIPLIVPITLFRHYFRFYPNEYVSNQTYLNPYPKEFRLRNRI